MRRWRVKSLGQEEIRANDNVRRSADGDECLEGIEHAFIVVFLVTVGDDLSPGRGAYEKRRACLVEPSRRWVERDAGGHVQEDLLYVRDISRRTEKGHEGRTGFRERDIVEGWSQHRTEAVYETSEARRVLLAAVNKGVTAIVPDVVAS